MLDRYGIIRGIGECNQHSPIDTGNLFVAGCGNVIVSHLAPLASEYGGSPMDTPRTWYIYALVDPRTDEVRYVGWTYTLKKRLRTHIIRRHRQNNHKAHWIIQLVNQGLEPRMLVLEEGSGDWQEAERRWIAHYRATGNLTNMTDGGDGTPGLYPSEETRRKMSAVHKGKYVTPETRAKLSANGKGLKRSPEVIAHMSAIRLGKPQTRTAKATAANRGRKQTPEHIAKRTNYQRPTSCKPRQANIIDGIEHWKCSRCGEFKPRDGFTTSSNNSGVSSACRVCLTESKRQRRAK